MRCCPKCRNVPNERGIPWDEREIKEESYLEFRTQPMIEAALREARQEAAQEAPQPERTEQQDAACGMLPACAPLANPFVPFQRDDPPVYAAAVGAVRGTLFPGLDLPLRGQENSGELSGTLQRDLQALGFAVVELGEYLDTHPGDARAAELFRSYAGLYAQAAAAWEAENGPILQRNTAVGSRERLRIGGLRGLRRFLDELEDAVGAGQRILQLRYHAGNFVEGLRILVGIAEEACQLADGDAAVHGAERARHADARIDE